MIATMIERLSERVEEQKGRRRKITLVTRGVHFSERIKRIFASGTRSHRRVASTGSRDPITAFPN